MTCFKIKLCYLVLMPVVAVLEISHTFLKHIQRKKFHCNVMKGNNIEILIKGELHIHNPPFSYLSLCAKVSQRICLSHVRFSFLQRIPILPVAKLYKIALCPNNFLNLITKSPRSVLAIFSFFCPTEADKDSIKRKICFINARYVSQ